MDYEAAKQWVAAQRLMGRTRIFAATDDAQLIAEHLERLVVEGHLGPFNPNDDPHNVTMMRVTTSSGSMMRRAPGFFAILGPSPDNDPDTNKNLGPPEDVTLKELCERLKGRKKSQSIIGICREFSRQHDGNPESWERQANRYPYWKQGG